MNKDVLARKIKKEWPELDNKQINGFAIELWSDISTWNREQKSKAIEAIEKPKKASSSKTVRYTPEERAQALSDLLDEKLDSGEITSSEIREFKDIFNLKAKDQDITIVQADFRGIDPDTADILEAVNWQINEYNENINEPTIH